ncbi:hypothetical protein [Bacillus sp. B15-48]|uniref:hypothetical protein n=1 Tax=Bacillus sp. B15-48 TaxID=1548601 RepID=UPI00193F890B|nr:hypothetical protein [Bacillus sp. B15-48]MBM4763227.1 hypothetical protein [Bacillus sp. B15-48]
MKDIEKALLAQTDQLKKTSKTLAELEGVTNDFDKGQKEQSHALDAADAQMGELFSMLGLKREEVDLTNETESSLIQLSNAELIEIKQRVPKIERVPILTGENWETYQQNIDCYIEKYDLDLTTDPIKQMLTTRQLKEIEDQFHQEFGNLKWNKWDYSVVGLGALVGFLVYLFVVKFPAEGAKKYIPAGQESEVGKWVNKAMSSLDPKNNEKMKVLEQWATTPYDAVKINHFSRIIEEADKLKMNGNLHRLKTPGHDPILQLIFGVLDCMSGTISVFDQSGKLAVLNNPNYHGTNIFMAVIKTLSHFITDIGTKRSVAPPFFTLTQAITFDTHIDINDRGTVRKMKLNEVAERMYSVGGYNFNHFLVMSLAPLCVEVIIRAYHWLTKPTTTPSLKRDYKLSSMLTLGHSLTMSGNVMKMWLNGWNPLAFNYSQMLMLVKSFYSLYKGKSERDRVIQNTLSKNWQAIHLSLT